MHELLAEGDFVRALARRLVAGHDVDDLVQDTWLVAANERPTAVQQPRSWLARVMQRLASNRARGDRRRLTREHRRAAAAPQLAPSTDEVLACEQVRQRVVDAVLALDEPFRATVLARFYECLDSETIAARDRVAVATVRSRLKRGLERLRARLDAVHGGQRAAWAAPLGLLHHEPLSLCLPTGVLMSTPKKVAAIAAVLVLAGIGWWTLSVGADPGIQGGMGASIAAAPNPAPDEQVSGANRLAAAVTVAPPSSGAAMRYPVVDEASGELAVRVLDVTTRRPVAGAEVLALPFRVDLGHELTRGDQALHEQVSSETFLERFGVRVLTGADGDAVVRVPVSGGLVLARHGDRQVSSYVAPATGSPERRELLWLQPARWLRFRVVDETTGAPVAGALLDVSSSAASPVVPESCSYGGCIGPADADGMIRMPWAADRQALRVRPRTLGGPRSIALDLPAALDAITVVRYPATGSLTIELRTPAGEPWPTHINAGVTIDGGGSWSSAGPTMWCSASPGIYRVPRIELGLRLQVSAHPQPQCALGGKTIVAGPTKPGEDVRVVLHTLAEPCIVAAELRFADGSVPPSNLWTNVTQDRAEPQVIRQYGLLEPGGRVRWTAAAAAAGPIQGCIELSRPFGNQVSQDGVPRMIGEWRLAAATPGMHDLGTIVVREPAVVVAGRVVPASSASGAPQFVDCATEAADGSWQSVHGLSATVRVDGSFEVRGTTTAARVRVALRPGRDALPSTPVVVAHGTRDVQLGVDRGAPLRVRVLPPPAYLQAVTCRAVRADGVPLPMLRRNPHDDEESFADATLAATDGEATDFVWPALPAGTYTVEVRLPGLTVPAATIDQVRVGDGAELDPRLQAIDLRRTVRTLTVVVASAPPGKQLDQGGVLVWPSGQTSGARHGLLFDREGRAEVAIGAEPVDVLVAVPGCRLWRAEGRTTTSIAVELEACAGVRVQLAPRVAEAFAGHVVQLWLEPKHSQEDNARVQFLRPGDREPVVQSSLRNLQRLAGDGACTLTDSRAQGTIPLSDFGSFRLGMMVGTHVSVNESWLQWQRSPLLPATIEWTAVDQPAVVVDVDAAVLAKVVDELSRRR